MIHRRIYVASSWRNSVQPSIVEALRQAGHEVYDFRNPAPGQKGFSWRDCGGEAAANGPGGGARTIPAYLEAVQSVRAREGFALDKAALEWCDTCLLVLPCGRSAHLELGYAAGQGKDTYVLLSEVQFEPELMYLLNTHISTSVEDCLAHMARREPFDVMRWHSHGGGHFAHPRGHALRLLREVIEACLSAGAKDSDILDTARTEIDQQLRKQQEGVQPDPINKELADVALLTRVIAGYTNTDLNAEARAKLAVLWSRSWEADMDGALYRPGRVPALRGE